MVESIQHVLSRVRPPRVQITYDVEIGGAIEKKELPFVVGIIADLAAKSKKAQPILKERKFVEIDRDNFDVVLAAIEPRVAFGVKRTLKTGTAVATPVPTAGGDDAKGGKDAKDAGKAKGKPEAEPSLLQVELLFHSMEDFNPFYVVKQIPELNALYEARIRLNDLSAKLDGNDELDDQLMNVLSDSGLAKTLATEAKGDIKTAATETDKIITEGKMIKGGDESAMPAARGMIFEFARQLEQTGDVQVTDTYFFLMQRIAFLDREVSTQLDEVMHDEAFQSLEGSWRGLHYLVFNTETGQYLKIRLLQITYKELSSDLQKAVEFDQSHLFKKIYEEEYGTFGGEPYACLVLDFAFGRNPQEVDILTKFTTVAAAAHAPALTAASPELFGMDSFNEMGAPRDLSKLFDCTDAIKWNSFRSGPDSRYMSLLLPRVLMRSPYGKDHIPVDEFDYEESVDGETNNKFCWGNPAYVMATRITHAFSLYQWTAAIRGVEGGGLVEDLPVYTFKSPAGDSEMKCPTEVIITDRREKELSELGFLALCHCKGTDYAAFFGGQTSQKPKKYNTDEANANALLSSRLPYMLNASRFAHYIKVMMRDKIGSFMSREDVENFLQTWLADYVLLSDMGSQEIKAKYPLREGKVYVKDIPGCPGSYKAVIFLRPHFQLEELNVSLRLVATLPTSAD